MRRSLFIYVSGIFAFASYYPAAQAADDSQYTITLKDNAFSPSDLAVPANQEITLTIHNSQAAPAEFESSDLGREKVVAANGSIIVRLGALKPGTYTYFNDFHHETSATITAK